MSHGLIFSVSPLSQLHEQESPHKSHHLHVYPCFECCLQCFVMCATQLCYFPTPVMLDTFLQLFQYYGCIWSELPANVSKHAVSCTGLEVNIAVLADCSQCIFATLCLFSKAHFVLRPK